MVVALRRTGDQPCLSLSSCGPWQRCCRAPSRFERARLLPEPGTGASSLMLEDIQRTTWYLQARNDRQIGQQSRNAEQLVGKQATSSAYLLKSFVRCSGDTNVCRDDPVQT